jgi:S-adenosylmethionine synthetase
MNTPAYPAEFVFPGHPDKLCDAIADALVERAAAAEQRSLCGVEVAIHMSTVFVSGRIAGEGAPDIDVTAVVREVYASAGYGEGWNPQPEGLQVKTALCTGRLNPGEAEFRSVSDDQSVVTGYAVDSPETKPFSFRVRPHGDTFEVRDDKLHGSVERRMHDDRDRD